MRDVMVYGVLKKFRGVHLFTSYILKHLQTRKAAAVVCLYEHSDAYAVGKSKAGHSAIYFCFSKTLLCPFEKIVFARAQNL